MRFAAGRRALRSLLPLVLVPLGAPGAPAAADDAPATVRPALEGLYTLAEVEGPRGRFTTEIVSLADGRARLRQQHPGRVTELVAIAGRGFERDASGAFVAADAKDAEALAGFVHGHDAPRLANAARRGAERPRSLDWPLPAAAGGGAVTIQVDDWRPSAGLELPWAATFLANGERYAYRYLAVLPFRLAPGAPDLGDSGNPDLLSRRLADLGELVAAHEQVMAAHRASDAEKLVADEAERSIVSGRGLLTQTTRAEMERKMRGYLEPIRFERYEDRLPPIVALSEDGTLGWLACEMDAEGVRTVEGKTEPLAYGFSWVELYAKAPDGDQSVLRWLRIGNASSVRP